MPGLINKTILVLALAHLVPACVWGNEFADLNSSYLNSDAISQDAKVKDFLASESGKLSPTFPYRINLFKEGEVTKNEAGVRASEKGNQIAGNRSGLVFFYELVTSAMRVPHWHSNTTEIGTVLEGKIRVTIWNGKGSPTIYTVEKNKTWIIPKATLHMLENIGNEKTEFLVAYDSPIAADRDFVTAWASLPDKILARSVGLSEADIAHIKKTTVNRLSRFEPNLTPDKKQVSSELSNHFAEIKPTYQSALGSIIRLDKKINPLLNAMALQKTILAPGALRVPHWYTSGDVLFFVLKGVAYFTLMDDEGKVYHALVRRGDLVSIPEGNFHGFLSVGAEQFEAYELFNHSEGANEISLMNGAQNFSAEVIEGATGVSKEAADKLKKHPPLGLIEAL